jgi:hypothetical protein
MIEKRYLLSWLQERERLSTAGQAAPLQTSNQQYINYNRRCMLPVFTCSKLLESQMHSLQKEIIRWASLSVRHRYRLSVEGCNSFCRINLVAFSIRVLDPGPPQYGTSVLRWRTETVPVGWESVPRSRQTNRRARGRERERERESEGRESPPGSVADGTRGERERKTLVLGLGRLPPSVFPWGFEIPKAGRSREVENWEGPHIRTFSCIKERYFFLVFLKWLIIKLHLLKSVKSTMHVILNLPNFERSNKMEISLK